MLRSRLKMNPYYDRTEAGRQLAGHLMHYADRPDVLVLGLPRGGVAVAHEVARELHVLLDIFLVRKLGVPGHEELALGAIASGGVRVLNADLVKSLGISEKTIDEIAAEEERELKRREKLYRGERAPVDVRGRIIILVDDGLATGATMRAAVAALQRQHPARIVVAVPVAARDTCADFAEEVDEVICAKMPDPFMAVGLWYEHFPQLTDEEVRELLMENVHS